MARNRVENGYQPYTPDEFDDPPEGPVGVHRGPRSLAVRMTPFVVVFLLAVLCGVSAWTVVSGNKLPWQSGVSSSSKIKSTRKTSPAPKEETSTPAPSEPVQPSTPPSSPAAPAPEVPAALINKASTVKVINGTTIPGHAAGNRQRLVSAGYTNVTASNPSLQLPQSSVVWYATEGDKATAEDVAKILGIHSVEQSTVSSASVTVVLKE
jgi:hypothetical protein